MLQARLLSHPDARCHRTGIGHAALPIGRPHGPVDTYHRGDHHPAGDLYRLVSERQRTQLIGNLCAPPGTVPRSIEPRQREQFALVDEGWASRVAEGLAIHREPRTEGTAASNPPAG